MSNINNNYILIVEDALDIQLLLQQLFASEGISLIQAYDGQQALNMLRTSAHLPSVVLLDIMMPVMDGLEFLQQRQQDPRLSSVPVIVMSADPLAPAKIKNFDVVKFVKKPITDIGVLLESVEKFRND